MLLGRHRRISALVLALGVGSLSLVHGADAPAAKSPEPAKAADENAAPPALDVPKETIAGAAPGFVAIGEADLVNVNGNEDTWTFKDGVIHCTGNPTGVIRTKKIYTNFEMVIDWRHLKAGGNSGVFVWTTEKSVANLPKGRLPQGIEVQVLDHGYTEQYEKGYKKKADWFTTNGDVFPVGVKLKPFPPLSPDKSRSFPRKNLSKGTPEWNHYYIRGVDGEVRLWVNGEEVSGGSGADPKSGYLCLESEGAPIEFKDFKIHELP